MRTCYVFQSYANPNLRGFTDSSTGEKLPADSGPWTFVERVNSDEQWTFNAGRAIVSAGILAWKIHGRLAGVAQAAEMT